MPKTVGEAWMILKQFGIKYKGSDFIFENAERIVEMNNELYDKLHTPIRARVTTYDGREV
jgi:hypothetical protein